MSIGTLAVFEDLEQRTPEWLAARAGIVTASQIGALITAKTIKPSTGETAQSLIARLAAERITGRVEETPQTWPMQQGVLEEPRARVAYMSTFDVDVAELGFMRRDWELGSLGYSPDGVVGDHGLIEIKTMSPYRHVKHASRAMVPPEHMAQLQAGLFVSGRDWIDYISWCPGLPMWTRRVVRDSVWQLTIQDVVEAAAQSIAETVRDFEAATAGMPTPEIIDYDEIRI